MTPVNKQSYLSRPATEYGRGPVRSIRKPEMSTGWKMFIIVTAVVTVLAVLAICTGR